MRLKYKVTVDGTAYSVEVEELGAGAAPFVSVPAAAVPAPVAAAPVASPPAASTPAPAPAPTPVAAPGPAAAGTVAIEAPLPGKILDVKVSIGTPVKTGDLVLMLEAMKMENEIFATANGTIKEIRVKSGDNVSTGDVMVVIG